MDAYIDSS